MKIKCRCELHGDLSPAHTAAVCLQPHSSRQQDCWEAESNLVEPRCREGSAIARATAAAPGGPPAKTTSASAPW